MPKKDILLIKDLAAFEKLVNRDPRSYDINMMVMPGTLEDKHKNVDPGTGIRALRRVFNLIYLLKGGEHDVQLGAEERWLKPNDLVIVPENMVYASRYIHQCQGYCIHFRTEFIQPLLKGPLAADFPYFDLEAEHIINVTDEESALLAQAFRDIITEHERFSHEKDHVLRNLIHILLLRVREIHRPHAKQMKEGATRAAELTNRFKHLVEKNFVEQRQVSWYADRLNITPKHLGDVVKETIGRTPRQVIADVLMLEAKVLLGSTDLTISQVAQELHFDDQAHFAHFIKLRSGLSPTELRAKL
jgi:AraC family transcriptional regulator, transcriptional activator of pobA